MQREAVHKLYGVADRVRIANDPKSNLDWGYLQASNNFRFMTTKPTNVGLDRGIYSSPFDAFTDYMNILGDYITRVNNLYPDLENEEISPLMMTIRNQEDEINRKDREIAHLQKTLELLKGNSKEKTSRTKTKKTPSKS
jgi:alpha-amylase